MLGASWQYCWWKNQGGLDFHLDTLSRELRPQYVHHTVVFLSAFFLSLYLFSLFVSFSHARAVRATPASDRMGGW